MPDPGGQRSFSFGDEAAGADEAKRTEAPAPLLLTNGGPSESHGGVRSVTEKGHAEERQQIAGKTVYVVDSHSLIYQVYHALPEMTSERGEPVSAVYGFTRDILYLIEEKHPDYLICAFDSPGATFRHAIYEPYKAGREAMPDDLSAQIPKIREVLDALGVPVIAVDTYEADDILASLARHCDRQEARCLLVTGDKDCRQLITDCVQLYNVRKDEVYDANQLQRDWGIRPDQVVDFQSLVGDPTDNVPGVPLIGPKIAAELLKTYGTLDVVLERAEEIQGAKRRQNLLEGGELAHLSRQLVRLDEHVPVEIDWSAATIGPIDRNRIGQLFGDFGFRSFMERIDRLQPGEQQTTWQAEYTLVDTPDKLADFLRQLKQQSRISVDTETTDVRPRWAELVGISFAWHDGEAVYLPVRAPAGDACLDLETTLNALRPVLEDPHVEKVGQNLKYDMIVLRAAGVRLAGVAFDTMVASYLLDAGQRNHGLDELSRRYLRHETLKIGDLIGKGKQQRTMDQVPVERVGPYAAEDA
ncbi:MAG: 5'-3' exonuclease H3TH domain-containing protein, partial [Pirellulales bacterium]